MTDLIVNAEAISAAATQLSNIRSAVRFEPFRPIRLRTPARIHRHRIPRPFHSHKPAPPPNRRRQSCTGPRNSGGELTRFLIASAVVVAVVAVAALCYGPDSAPPVVTPARGDPCAWSRESAPRHQLVGRRTSEWTLFDHLVRSAHAFATGHYEDQWLVREASEDLLARVSSRAARWTAVYPGPLPTVVLAVDAYDAQHGTITLCSVDQSHWVLASPDAEPTTEVNLGRVSEYTVRPNVSGGGQFTDLDPST